MCLTWKLDRSAWEGKEHCMIIIVYKQTGSNDNFLLFFNRYMCIKEHPCKVITILYIDMSFNQHNFILPRCLLSLPPKLESTAMLNATSLPSTSSQERNMKISSHPPTQLTFQTSSVKIILFWISTAMDSVL